MYTVGFLHHFENIYIMYIKNSKTGEKKKKKKKNLFYGCTELPSRVGQDFFFSGGKNDPKNTTI